MSRKDTATVPQADGATDGDAPAGDAQAPGVSARRSRALPLKPRYRAGSRAHFLAATIQLEEVAANTDQQVRALEARNKELRARWAMLRIACRLSEELLHHHQTFGRREEKARRMAFDDAREVAALRAALAAAGAPDDGVEDPVAAIPHLAPGLPLLRLDGVTQEEVDEARAMTLDEFRERWVPLVHAGIPLLTPSETDPRAADALRGIGRRMERLMALACIWSTDKVFVPFMGQRTDCPSVPMVSKADSSTWGHPEDAKEPYCAFVVRHTGYSIAQAVLMIAATDMFGHRIQELGHARKDLSRQLQQHDEAGGTQPGELGASSLSRADILEAIEELTGSERHQFVLTAQMMRVISTPLQFAKVWCHSWPWPVHQIHSINAVRKNLELVGRGGGPSLLRPTLEEL